MPSRSWNTRTCPSVAGPAPIPITGIASISVTTVATAAGIASNTTEKQPASWSAGAAAARNPPKPDREAAGPLERERVLRDRERALRGPALGAVAAERGRRLRGEADVPHYRDPR